MKKSVIGAAVAVIAMGFGVAGHAQTIIDTGTPEKLVQVGVRMGFNTSNLSTNFDDAYPEIVWNHGQWRNGFSAGAVVDLNLKNYLAIESGLNFRSRNNSFHYLVDDTNQLTAVDGKWGGYYLEIPLLLSLRLGVAELGQVHVDAGPYWATGFGGKCHYTYISDVTGIVDTERAKGDYFGDKGIANRSDWGFKIGLGLLVMQHYYIGASYNAGCSNVLRKDADAARKLVGHNKVWTFSIGYNF